MPQIVLPGTLCSIESDHAVDEAFLKSFTDFKAKNWGRLGAGVDEYILGKLTRHLEVACDKSVLSDRVVAAIRSPEYLARLKDLVYAPLNHGLAVICYNPSVRIPYVAPLCVLPTERFEEAVRRLTYAFFEHNKHARDDIRKEVRARVTQSRVWVDACAYSIFTSVARKLGKKVAA